jgi:hypothetical protein
LIAGAHPNANLDGRADLVQPENKQNLFHLVYQVMLRESGSESQVILQSRAFAPRSDRPSSTADILFTTSEGQASRDRRSPLLQHLLQLLEEDGLRVQPIEGAPDTAGFEAGGIAQALYLNQTQNKEFVVLWSSTPTRARYSWQTESQLQEAQFRELGIPSVVTDLSSYLASLGTQAPSATVPDRLRGLIERYMRNHDTIALRVLRHDWPQFRFERLLDQNSGQTFLIISASRTQLPVVVNLTAPAQSGKTTVSSAGIDQERIDYFMNSRAGWLEFTQIEKEAPS